MIRKKWHWHWTALRFVVLGPLYLVIQLGEGAEFAGKWLQRKLPDAFTEYVE